MAPLFPRHALALLLTSALAHAAQAAGPTCREALSRDVTGVSIDDRIAFLRDGNQFCDKTVGEEDCRESFQAMIQNLEELRAKLDTACREGEHAAERARGACKGAHSCLEAVRPVVEHAKQSLASVQEHLDKMSGDMKMIREYTILKVRQWLTSMDKRPAPAANAPPPPRMAPMADTMLRAAENPNTNPEDLRRQILALNGKGIDQVVVSMWAAANALELEHFSKVQRRRAGSTITGLAKGGEAVGGRAARLNTTPETKSSLTGLDGRPEGPAPREPAPRDTGAPAAASSNGLSALPGLVSAAGQLAGAASGSAAGSAASGTPGDLLAPRANRVDASKLPSVAELVSGKGSGPEKPAESATDAGPGREPKVSSLGRKASDFSFGTGGRGKTGAFSGKPGGGESRTGAGSRATLMRVEGQPLGATGGDGAAAASPRLPAAAGRPGDPGGEFASGEGFGSAPGSSGDIASAAETGFPAAGQVGPAELAALLENPPAHGTAAAGDLVSSSGPTLFTRIWVAHNRSLKRGLVTGPRKPL